jgi:hypothetical protein
MITFPEICRLQDISERCLEKGITLVVVDSKITQNFSNSLMNFHNHLKDVDILDSWLPLVSVMKRFHYLLVSTMLPPEIIRELSKSKNTFQDEENKARRAGEDTQELFKSLINDYLAVLTHLKENPLWNGFIKHGPKFTNKSFGPEILFNCHSYSLLDSMDNFLTRKTQINNRGKLYDIETNTKIKSGNRTYKSIVITGTAKWLDRDRHLHLLAAPKSDRIFLFSHSHFDLKIPALSRIPFNNGQENLTIPTKVINFLNNEPSLSQTTSKNKPEELSHFTIPKFNPKKVEEGIHKARNALDEENEDTEAYRYLLAGEKLLHQETEGIFFQLEYTNEGQGINCSDVSKKDADEIDEGDVIIIATDGGGDMIRPVADEILMESGRLEDYRSLQSTWKKKLRELHDNLGHEYLMRRLKDEGVAVQNANLRYWISSRCIGPGDDKVFGGLLKFLGFPEQSENIKEATRVIRNAHTKAGRILAGKLRDSIKGQSLEQLFELGEQRFSRADIEGSQTAYLVEKRFPETSCIPSNLIMKIIEIEGDTWH